jgi:hypothetical protein
MRELDRARRFAVVPGVDNQDLSERLEVCAAPSFLFRTMLKVANFSATNSPGAATDHAAQRDAVFVILRLVIPSLWSTLERVFVFFSHIHSIHSDSFYVLYDGGCQQFGKIKNPDKASR